MNTTFIVRLSNRILQVWKHLSFSPSQPPVLTFQGTKESPFWDAFHDPIPSVSWDASHLTVAIWFFLLLCHKNVPTDGPHKFGDVLLWNVALLLVFLKWRINLQICRTYFSPIIYKGQLANCWKSRSFKNWSFKNWCLASDWFSSFLRLVSPPVLFS